MNNRWWNVRFRSFALAVRFHVSALARAANSFQGRYHCILVDLCSCHVLRCLFTVEWNFPTRTFKRLGGTWSHSSMCTRAHGLRGCFSSVRGKTVTLNPPRTCEAHAGGSLTLRACSCHPGGLEAEILKKKAGKSALPSKGNHSKEALTFTLAPFRCSFMASLQACIFL